MTPSEGTPVFGGRAPLCLGAAAEFWIIARRRGAPLRILDHRTEARRACRADCPNADVDQQPQVETLYIVACGSAPHQRQQRPPARVRVEQAVLRRCLPMLQHVKVQPELKSIQALAMDLRGREDKKMRVRSPSEMSRGGCISCQRQQRPQREYDGK